MKYDDFVNGIQSKLELPDRARAIRAIRATLTTLGERLHPDEAKDLASNLPMEIDRFMLDAKSGQRFDYKTFVERVSKIENCDKSDAAYHSQLIMEHLAEAVPGGEFRQVRESLPDDYDDLFELVPQATPD